MMKRFGKIALVGAAGLVLFTLGRWSGGGGGASRDGMDSPLEQKAAALWTCPMHPQIRLPDPGDCPICGMDLVPVEQDLESNPRQLVLSPAAKELAKVAVEVVQRREVTRPIRMVGKIDFDETTVRTISAWVSGRLEQLFVDYTGVRVNEGDHLVSLYSPELLAAQEELLSASARLAVVHGDESSFLADSDRRAHAVARDKLRLLGLTEEQVTATEERGVAEDHVMLTSPATGVVIEKRLEQGAYVQTGTSIYKIADLDRLWVRLDAYEQDLPWLRYGQTVVVQAEALPGETFEGLISFIDPIIHEHTRTAKVRVNIENTSGRLKPGMFVRAVASARLGKEGVVLDRSLAGKWISPMHPEVVKDGPGQCDVCGMSLVPAEVLGLVSSPEHAAAPLPIVVPHTAVLLTGKRAVVYVEVQGAENPTYEGREVLLGPRAGDNYIVLSGLEEGEHVVTNGAFRIDSSMQILARPSMMSMPGEKTEWSESERRSVRASLRPLLEAYLSIQEALAVDDLERARKGLAVLDAALETSGVQVSAPEGWHGWHRVHKALHAVPEAADIEAYRTAFGPISIELIAIEEVAGNPMGSELRVIHCPMAFENRGADWIQVGEAVANPYFGSEMSACGRVVRLSSAEEAR